MVGSGNRLLDRLVISPPRQTHVPTRCCPHPVPAQHVVRVASHPARSPACCVAYPTHHHHSPPPLTTTTPHHHHPPTRPSARLPTRRAACMLIGSFAALPPLLLLCCCGLAVAVPTPTGMQVRDDLTVIMVAPKCPGTEVRNEYLRGFGAYHPCATPPYRLRTTPYRPSPLYRRSDPGLQRVPPRVR